MYEDTIAAAAAALSQRGDKPNGKTDRTYTERMTELLTKLDTMGFGSWTVKSLTPVRNAWSDPKAVLSGVEVASGAAVEMELYNNHGKLVPKHLAFSMYKVEGGRGVVIGQHVGQFRITDLRTKTSQYDGVDWSATHFQAFLAVAAFRGRLAIPKDRIEKHMARAIAKMEELGITEPRHCLLPRNGTKSIISIEMEPYLVGKYGEMPVALALHYKESNRINLGFYIIGPRGTCVLKFGELEVDENGQADGQVDVAALLAGPERR